MNRPKDLPTQARFRSEILDFDTDNKYQEIGAKAYDFIFRNAKSYCKNDKKI